MPLHTPAGHILPGAPPRPRIGVKRTGHRHGPGQRYSGAFLPSRNARGERIAPGGRDQGFDGGEGGKY
jgi:hypothetical protein